MRLEMHPLGLGLGGSSQGALPKSLWGAPTPAGPPCFPYPAVEDALSWEAVKERGGQKKCRATGLNWGSLGGHGGGVALL